MLYLEVDFSVHFHPFPHLLFFSTQEWKTLHHNQGRGWDVSPQVKAWLEENIGPYHNPYRMNPDGKTGAWSYEIDNLAIPYLRPHMEVLKNGFIFSTEARRCAFLAFQSEEDAMKTKLIWG